MNFGGGLCYSQYVSLEDTYVRSRRPRFSHIEKAKFKQVRRLSGNFESKRALYKLK